MTAWTPPEGMLPAVVAGWRGFYRDILIKYGITPTQYRDQYIAQHGCCYICRKAVGKNPDDPKGKGGRRLAVDHNHFTGATRALLCSGSTSANTCNRLIARYSVQALKRAIAVLEEEPMQAVISFRASWPIATDADMKQILELS